MQTLFKLTFAFLLERPLRLILTTLATSASICIVVWVTSGYEALQRTYDEYANLALGRYELAIAPISMNREDIISEETLKDLRKDSNIAAADPMGAHKLRVETILHSEQVHPLAEDSDRFGRGPGSGPRAILPEILVLSTSSAAPPFELEQGKWLNQDQTAVPEIVVRKDVAAARRITVGDRIKLAFTSAAAGDSPLPELLVVGIVNAPSLPGAGTAAIPILSPGSGDAFIAESLLEKIPDAASKISLIGVSLAPEADLTQFRFGWAPKLSQYSTPVQFQEAYEIEEALDQAAAAQNVKMQSYIATAAAMLVALLVIFCTLSVGVTERSRQYAILRAITLTRGQVAILIAIEGFVLGALGLLGGLLLGISLLKVAERVFGHLLYHGTEIGWFCLQLSLIAAMGGAFLASLIPIVRATRVRPIDAMAPPTNALVERPISVKLCGLGCLLILANPCLTFLIPHTEQSLGPVMVVGFIGMTAGFVMLAPIVVLLVDRWLSPLWAKLFSVDPKLIESQLTYRLWRTIGAAISMAFGMGLFIAIQVWGFTMLQAFIPGDWAPDAMVAFPKEFTAQDLASFQDIQGVHPSRSVPFVVEQPRLSTDITGSAERASVTRQDNVIIVGFEADRAFAADSPLLDLEWVNSNRSEAVQTLKQKRSCIVPDHFLVETGLGIGDSIELVPPENPAQPVKYEIAGAVRIPGWHWQTKLTGLRPRTHRAAALVFADFQFVSTDFQRPRPSHIWFDYDTNPPSPLELTASIQNWFDSHQQPLSSSNQFTADTSQARVIPVEQIRNHIRGTARRWIWLVSQLPLVTLFIACLGVLNLMLASIRSRQWEFGVLRSIGFTGPELVRAILIEGLQIASVAAILSLGFGIISGWCGCGMAQYFSFFGGLNPDLIVPWDSIGIGLGIMLFLGLASALWPALSIGRRKPLDLMQNGVESF